MEARAGVLKERSGIALEQARSARAIGKEELARVLEHKALVWAKEVTSLVLMTQVHEFAQCHADAAALALRVGDANGAAYLALRGLRGLPGGRVRRRLRHVLYHAHRAGARKAYHVRWVGLDNIEMFVASNNKGKAGYKVIKHIRPIYPHARPIELKTRRAREYDMLAASERMEELTIFGYIDTSALGEANQLTKNPDRLAVTVPKTLPTLQ